MQMECPACRKKSDNTDNCPRCDLDLLPLRHILILSEHYIAKSLSCLYSQEYSHAFKNALQAWSLKKSEKSARLAFFSALLEDNFIQAGVWFKRCEKFRLNPIFKKGYSSTPG
jgi:hypothetical protein